MWAHSFEKKVGIGFKAWELLRPVLAAKLRQQDEEFAGEVFIKSGSLANRRTEFVDRLTNVSE
jgi:hypothetical protein